MMNGVKHVEGHSPRSLRPMVAAWMLCAAAGHGAATYYVWRDNPSPQTPFTNWTMAATSIQDAVDLTQNGDTVLVTNGTYDTGGAVTPGYALTNRVCMTNAITLRSVNPDPALTIIQGAPAPSGECGTGAVRCVYIAHNALLSGFTISNGYTRKHTDTPVATLNDSAAGIYMNASGAVVSNCIIRKNKTTWWAGGVYLNNGTINNCTVINNTANYAGGVVVRGSSSVNNCLIATNTAGNGGGLYVVHDGRINNCRILMNTGVGVGGGLFLDTTAIGCVLKSCEVANNKKIGGDNQGGGAGYVAGGKLVNCTITGNTAPNNGGGLKLYKDAMVTNCILWGNTVTSGSDSNYWLKTAATTAVVAYTCSGPLLSGIRNKAADPLFADPSRGNYRLRTHSPCIDAGNKQGWMTSAVDLDGHKRIYGGQVDMGAYEKFCPGVIFSIR